MTLRVIVPLLALLAAAPGRAVFGEPASDARPGPLYDRADLDRRLAQVPRPAGPGGP